MPLHDYYHSLYLLYQQIIQNTNKELIISCFDLIFGSLTYFLPNVDHKDIFTEGINSLSKLFTFTLQNLEVTDAKEVSSSLSMLKDAVFVLIQFEVFLEKLSGGFGGRNIQSLVIFAIELLKGISRLHILFTKQESAAMLIKWGRAHPHGMITIDDYITWCDVNVQNYVTQQLKSLSLNFSSNSLPNTTNSLTTRGFGQSTMIGDDFNVDGDIDGDEPDDETRLALQIRFISVSSVSSSAFTQYYVEDSNSPNNEIGNEMTREVFGQQRLRTRSNTLERLEEEKRVRWSDEHYGSLTSTLDTTPLLVTSQTHTYIHYHLPISLFPSSTLKLSPSFESLLASSSPNQVERFHHSSSSSGSTTPDEFLVGTGIGYDSNDESPLSAMTHPNGVTTIVNLIHHDSFTPELQVLDEDYFGKILLKGKLTPRSRRMKRKSKITTPMNTNPSMQRSQSAHKSLSTLSTSSSTSTFLFASPVPSPSFRAGNNFETTENEKIPILGTIGSIDIDAGQVLLFGEVLYILRPVIYSLLLAHCTTRTRTHPQTQTPPVTILEFSLDDILHEKNEEQQPNQQPQPHLASHQIDKICSLEPDLYREKQTCLVLAISMVIELISIICTMIAIQAIRDEAIQQCKLEIKEYFQDHIPDSSSSSLSSSSTTSSASSSSFTTTSSSSGGGAGPGTAGGRDGGGGGGGGASSSTRSRYQTNFENLITAEKCIPKHPIDEEIKRRKLLYLLNLLKTPLFNRATLPILTRIVKTIHRIPLIGSLPQHMLDTLFYINRTYFHTSNSSS